MATEGQDKEGHQEGEGSTGVAPTGQARTVEPNESWDAPPTPPSRAGRWKIFGVFVVFAGLAITLMVQSQASETFVYSKLVHEVMGSPDRFLGRTLRVEGDLKEGSVQRRESPCEWRFVLSKQGEEMPVRFPGCVVPDTFRDDMGISVTVQGQLQDGFFLADQVIPKCPSKYEMNQKQQAGEEMPHAPVPGAPMSMVDPAALKGRSERLALV